MKRVMLLLLLVLTVVTMNGCFKEKEEEKKDVGVGVNLLRDGNVVKVVAKETIAGAEIVINRIVAEADIEGGKNMLIVKNNNGKTLVAAINPGSNIIAGEVIYSIKCAEKIEVSLTEGIKPENLNQKVKSRGMSIESLLGDFDSNGEVGITDFKQFEGVYGKVAGDAAYNVKFDISNAVKGTSAGWENIYAKNTPDNKISIFDFIVFGYNYGKSVVTRTIKTITIIGDASLEAGKNGLYSTKTEYTNGETSLTETVNWSIANTSAASLTVSGTSAVLTGKSEGTTEILVEKNGIKATKSILITKKTAEPIIINIEDTASSKLLYSWVTVNGAVKTLLGAWPGTTLTTLDGKFYKYDFGTEYTSINYIHNVGGKSANLSTDKSIWIMADGSIKTANPYIPTKPTITITPNKSVVNPEQKIKIAITVSQGTIDSYTATFNGKSIVLSNNTAEVTVADYVASGKTGELYVTATNSLGTTEARVAITADPNVILEKPAEQKLYIETNQNVYAWNVNSSGAVEKLNGDWPGKPLVTTVTMTGHTWYLFDFTGKEGAMFIINGKGGETGTSISKSTWIKADNTIYYQDPYEPTKPIISISPGGGIVNDSKQEKVITIKVTALNAAIDQKSVVIGTKSVTLTADESTIKISDYINNGETATIKVTASNVIGTTTKEITIKRDDSYVVPTGEFTWGNANVYFVLTDRFFNGNPSNDNSYGRKNKLSPAPLDVATYHGGDLAGLTKKIEEGYFSELGVNAIWFSAAYEQIHGWVGGGSGDFPHYPFHGYYALDWTMMDRNMGNIEEMRKFVNTAHENNIRVVMDVVVNHAGYNTIMDMYDYGFSSYETSVITGRDWMHPMVASGWQSHHEKYVFYSAAQLAKNGVKPTPITDWLNWWGPDWVRTGIDGYSAGNGSELQNPLAGLPDIKTEVTDPVAMAPIMQTKWKLEAADGDDAYDTAIGGKYENYIVPAAKYLRNPDTKIAPADHVIKSLAAWVEEFGIDGFRCDTAKHIELSRWKQLQSECDASLKKWRAAHATDPASKWTDNFWMVGEHWDFKNGGDGGYFSNGFTTMLDFGFPLKNGGTGSTMISTWAGYASTVNKAMPYINSHDMGKVGFFGKGSSCIPAGTALLLNPSPVQIYYGDENDREKAPSCSDADMMLRSDYQWGANPDKLAHWQKVGKFRNLNPAVGAGVQTPLTAQSGAIKRKWKEDTVVIVVNANGKTDINLSEVTEWPDGTKLRNGYNGEEAVVTGGKVSFTGENGIILIEDAVKIKR